MKSSNSSATSPVPSHINRTSFFFFLYDQALSCIAVVVSILYVHHLFQCLVLVKCFCGGCESGIQAEVGCNAVSSDGHCWGSSDGCFLGFRVSMRDWTLRLTLVVTRRVTESEEGDEEEPAR